MRQQREQAIVGPLMYLAPIFLWSRRQVVGQPLEAVVGSSELLLGMAAATVNCLGRAR